MPLWLEALQMGEPDHRSVCLKRLRALASIDYPPIACMLDIGFLPELVRTLQRELPDSTALMDAVAVLDRILSTDSTALSQIHLSSFVPALCRLWRNEASLTTECFQLVSTVCTISVAARDALIAAGLINDVMVIARTRFSTFLLPLANVMRAVVSGSVCLRSVSCWRLANRLALFVL